MTARVIRLEVPTKGTLYVANAPCGDLLTPNVSEARRYRNGLNGKIARRQWERAARMLYPYDIARLVEVFMDPPDDGENH